MMLAFVVATEADAAEKKKPAVKKPAAKKKAAAAKKKAPRNKGKAGGVQKQFSNSDIYAKMDFKPGQREKFEAIQQKLQTALDAWDASPKGQKLLELQAAADTASTPEEKSKAAGAMGQIRQLSAERSAIERRYEPEILAILTPQQKATLLGHKLCNKILSGKLGKALKADQVGKLKSYCMQAGAGIVKGSVSAGRAEAQLQSLAIGLLDDGQKKKLGIRVPPKKDPKKNNDKNNRNRRRQNNNKKKPTKQQIEAYKKAQAAHKKAVEAVRAQQ